MKKSKGLHRAILGILLLLLYTLGYSMFVGNYLDKGFTEGGMTAGSNAQEETIKSLIAKSATYFLRGKTNIDLLASKLEAADIENLSFNELQGIINNAVDNFKTARYYYLELKNRAGAVPYNQEIISKLISFDYEAFLNENDLNRDIYDQVRVYLGKGNVRGIFDRFYSDIENINQLVEIIQHKVSCSEIPGLNISWKLNQECAHMLLFGQYSSQIFYSLI